MGAWRATEWRRALSVAPSIRNATRWWRAEKDDVHMYVGTLVRRIRDDQLTREQMDLDHTRLYGNVEIAGLGPNSYWRTPGRYEQATLAFNVVAQASDTITAKLSKNRPLPMFLTTGGNYSMQRKARDLGRFIEGEFFRCKVFELGSQLVLDACVWGTGLATVYRRGNKIVIERVFPWELIVDAAESQYGTPRSMYQRRWVDREQLAKRFPGHREEIEAARSDDERDANLESSTSDLVLVIEAWRLPDDEIGVGRHVTCISNATLADEPWKHDYFPFIPLRKKPSLMGYWGIGVAQELCGLQYELNFTSERVQSSMRVMGGSGFIVDNNSDVSAGHFTNEPGIIIRKRPGTQITPFTPTPIHPAHMEYLFKLKDSALPETGASALSARSEKPSGVTAGIALETLNDIESERFLPFYRSYEEWAMEVARQFIDIGKEIAKDDPSYEVRVIGKRNLRIVRFADVDIDRDSYVMRVFPTSLLAKTPTARLQQVTDWANIGWITQTEAKLLLDFPDLDRVRQLSTSSYELVEEILERILDGDAEDPKLFIGPEPQMNLAEAMSLSQLTYLRAKLDGAPELNLDLLRRWYDLAKRLYDLQKAASNDNAGAAAPLAATGTDGGAMPPGAPPGPPMPGPGMPPMPGGGVPPLPMGNA